jgi:SAM-dependent methyltransferase
VFDRASVERAFVELLSRQPQSFFSKCAAALIPGSADSLVLDVGCGVGQTLSILRSKGVRAVGVEASRAHAGVAREAGHDPVLADGARLPFPSLTFGCAGAFNVLEHVKEPERFIRELARVTARGGRVVLSSPNFLRVIGFRDYHRRMRGLRSKCRNLLRLLEKSRRIRRAPRSVTFDRMEPVLRLPPRPDDDAVVATNPLEICFFLERAGCEVLRAECTDRVVPRLLDRALNLSPLRFLMLNAFVVARKR